MNTIKNVVDLCAKLRESTGKEWHFKGNKGTIKLVCMRTPEDVAEKIVQDA